MKMKILIVNYYPQFACHLLEPHHSNSNHASIQTEDHFIHRDKKEAKIIIIIMIKIQIQTNKISYTEKRGGKKFREKMKLEFIVIAANQVVGVQNK